ncbi:MAG: polyprenyl synthetase family protein [Phycisphaerales bacterium]|nr:polyprenyl synthetase family protein [Phycisphaerales bacterium]
MNTPLDNILQKELIEFDIYFSSLLKATKSSLLDRILAYLVKRKGKKIRPILVFLTAQMVGRINQKTLRAAALSELLHTATLVHDDVVDNAMERRSFFSINALWKNKAAVLLGDFLLAKGLLLSLEHEDFTALLLLSKAVKSMSEGELLQMQKARSLDIDEPTYFEIINGKTASLFSASCAIGVASVTNDKQIVEYAGLIGQYLGICYQIKDDLLDLGTNHIGKPIGQDIEERKFTLPLIYTLQHCSSDVKKELLYLIKKKKIGHKEKNRILEIITLHKGINYATAQMSIYQNKAIEVLANFDNVPAKDNMKLLIDFMVNRTH